MNYIKPDMNLVARWNNDIEPAKSFTIHCRYMDDGDVDYGMINEYVVSTRDNTTGDYSNHFLFPVDMDEEFGVDDALMDAYCKFRMLIRKQYYKDKFRIDTINSI